MKYVVILLLIFPFNFLLGQCPSTILLETQGDVDSFNINYPECINLQWLNINGQNITNLDSLAQIETVKSLSVDDTGLENLHGLEGLSSISYWLSIEENKYLTDISQLDYSFEGKYFYLTENQVFNGMLPLHGVEELVGLAIRENAALATIQGVEDIEKISGYLDFTENVKLDSITGFEKMWYCDELDLRESNVKWLGKFPSLLHLNDLSLFGNEKLEDISQFDKLNVPLRSVKIQKNPKLSACEIICTITNSSTWVMMEDNATGCSSARAIKCPKYISGAIYYDANRNKVQDDDEYGISGVFVHKNELGFWQLSNRQGEFGLDGQVGKSFTLAPKIDFDEWELTTDSQSYSFVFNESDTLFQNLNFGVVPSVKGHEVEVVLVHSAPKSASIILKNKGGDYEKGEAFLRFDTDLKYDYSYPDGVLDTLEHTLVWDVELKPYEAKIIYIGFYAGANVSPFKLTGSFRQILDDGQVHITEFERNDIFDTGSFYAADHLSVTPVGETSEHFVKSDDWLTYAISIRENESGTLVVADLDAGLDPSTVEFVFSRKNIEIKIENGKIRFFCNDGVNYGFEQIIYKIKPYADLKEGVQIDNQFTVFDSFGSSTSNAVFNTIHSPLRDWEITDDDLLIGPNPTSDFFRIQHSEGYDVKGNKLLIYNDLGEIVRVFEVASNKRYFICGLPSGCYTVALQVKGSKQKNLTGKLFIQ